MLEHLEPVILQTLRVCRPYVAALTLEQGLQKCSEVVQAAQKPGMGGVWLPLFCACLVLLSALMWATQLALSAKHTWDNRKGGIAELTREPSSPGSPRSPRSPGSPRSPRSPKTVVLTPPTTTTMEETEWVKLWDGSLVRRKQQSVMSW